MWLRGVELCQTTSIGTSSSMHMLASGRGTSQAAPSPLELAHDRWKGMTALWRRVMVLKLSARPHVSLSRSPLHKCWRLADKCESCITQTACHFECNHRNQQLPHACHVLTGRNTSGVRLLLPCTKRNSMALPSSPHRCTQCHEPFVRQFALALHIWTLHTVASSTAAMPHKTGNLSLSVWMWCRLSSLSTALQLTVTW